jgi:hypothetical protein
MGNGIITFLFRMLRVKNQFVAFIFRLLWKYENYGSQSSVKNYVIKNCVAVCKTTKIHFFQ